MDCPVCPQKDIKDGQLRCPNCRTDLTLLVKLREFPSLLFNRALANLQSPNPNMEEAKSQLLMAVQLHPRLVEPHVLLAKLYVLQGNYSAAFFQLLPVVNVGSGNKEIVHLMDHVYAMLNKGVADGECTRVIHQGKSIYLWSKVQSLDGNFIPIYRLVPEKDTDTLSHIIIRTTGFFPRSVILDSEHIVNIEQVSVIVKLRLHDINLLPRYCADEVLTEAIESALLNYSPIQSLEYKGIHLDVNGGVVVLSGNMGSEINRKIAEDIVRSVPGVIEIQNRIRSDRNLESTLASCLAGEPNRGHITVKSIMGQISLEGKVMSDNDRESIESIVQATEGVRTVMSNIKVKKQDPDSDSNDRGGLYA